MTSLHMVGHMVTVAVIATLVKQLMQLKFNLHDLKVELCDQETDAAQFKNNFCEKGGKHGSEESGDKSGKSDTGEKTKKDKKSGIHTDTGEVIDTGTDPDRDTCVETEVKNEEKTTDLGEIRQTSEQITNQDRDGIAFTEAEIQKEKNADIGETTNVDEQSIDSETDSDKEIEKQKNVVNDNLGVVNDWYSEEEHHVPFESSVWCHEPDNGFCHFNNLCYNTVEDDLFIMAGNESVFENVDFSDGSILLELSSVKKHNVHQKFVGSIPVETTGKLKITWVKDTVLLFNRFKPDNLMHALHDDILPMYHSLRLISMTEKERQSQTIEKPNIQLVFFEGWDMGDFSELYRLFSAHSIILKENLKSKGAVVCFSNAYTGVSKSTVWYDYGFHTPQGPVDNIKVTDTMIHSLVKYVIKQFKLAVDNKPSKSDYLVLLTRKQNRKIVNEGEFTLDIVQKLGIKVLNVNFEMFELSKIIEIIHNSKGIIGMHGSLLSLAMFLKPGSVLLELFPYAVNPDHYTPFKTLASVKGMGIVYRAWRNMNPENSKGFSERDLDEGGLGHLSEAERTEIMDQTEVPRHLCCSDPSWLYHIYQDTAVDVTEVISLVRSSLEESEIFTDQSELSVHPLQVKTVSCFLSATGFRWALTVRWETPWNFELFGIKDVHYDILVQDMSDKESVKSYVTETSPFVIDIPVANENSYFVWVRCGKDNLNGPYSDSSECVAD